MASVRKAERKREARLRKRRFQLRRFRETGKRGFARAAAINGRAARKLAGIIARLLSVAPGFPFWGGSKRVVMERAAPIVARKGIPATSGKRRETFGNPGSDHYILNLFSFAKDWATADNQALAQELRSELTPGETHHDYEEFFFRDHGHLYRGQIIAATHGTGPHLHLGVKRIS